MNSITVDTPATTAPVPGHEAEGRRLSHVMAAVLIGYVCVILILMFKDGALMTPDLFVVLALVVAMVLGRTRMFLRDWLPFAAIFLGWESMRGLADNLGATVHSDDVIAVERFFFFGRVPSEVLQAAFHKAGQVNLLDIGTTFLYAAHFAFPLVVAFIFWTLERRLFYRYLLALLLMSFAAFFCYLLIPVAPPRFAGSYGQPLAVEDIAQSTFSQLNFAQVTTWLYGAMPGNQVAAFPSLHAAYPLLAYLFARTRWPRASLIALAWSVAMWFSVVYLGHHYVIDVVAGILFAIGAYAALQSSTLKRFASWLASFGRRPVPQHPTS